MRQEHYFQISYIFKKDLYKIKASSQHHNFIYFDIKPCNILDC